MVQNIEVRWGEGTNCWWTTHTHSHTRAHTHNPQMVLERGEKLELLVDKTEQLQTQADSFRFTSKKLKEVMFWKTVHACAAVHVFVHAFVRACVSTSSQPPFTCPLRVITHLPLPSPACLALCDVGISF